jgi:hypothetical protein
MTLSYEVKFNPKILSNFFLSEDIIQGKIRYDVKDFLNN